MKDKSNIKDQQVENDEKQPLKKIYSKPQLKLYGNLNQLTNGTTGRKADTGHGATGSKIN